MAATADIGPEAGILWESKCVWPINGSPAGDMGFAVFGSFAERDEAIEFLVELGYRYIVRFNDAKGPGVIYSERDDVQAIRPDRRLRLPSYQRAMSDRWRNWVPNAHTKGWR